MPPPLWVFQRRRDIEMEVGLVLAGQLVFDAPDDKKLSRKARREAGKAIRTLTVMARLGRLPDYAVAVGWRTKCPANANEFTDNETAISTWTQDRYSIAVRVAPHGSGKIRPDTDWLRQIGIMPTLQ